MKRFEIVVNGKFKGVFSGSNEAAAIQAFFINLGYDSIEAFAEAGARDVEEVLGYIDVYEADDIELA